MSRFNQPNTRERLVRHVHNLERLELERQLATQHLKDGLDDAANDGFDPSTLKVVLKLRRMTPDQRRERRALEAIYLAALGMLEGDPLTEEARRRLDGHEPPDPSQPGLPETSPEAEGGGSEAVQTQPPQPAQPQLALKDPAEARQEGADAAAAGKRIYDNPYAAGDPCRAAWDEGWCAQSGSHGMDTPSAYQRRSTKPDKKDEDGDPAGEGGGKKEEGAA